MPSPDDRYASVQALYDAARARRLRNEERTIETVALRTEAVASDAFALCARSVAKAIRLWTV